MFLRRQQDLFVTLLRPGKCLHTCHYLLSLVLTARCCHLSSSTVPVVLQTSLFSVVLTEPCLAQVHPHDWGSEVADTDTKALHALLSFASWTHSATDIPVHCLMSPVQRLRGLPWRLFPATIPCRTCVQRLLARTTWLKYSSFLLLTSARKRRAGSNSSNIELLVLCSVQLILIILLYMSMLTETMYLILSPKPILLYIPRQVVSSRPYEWTFYSPTLTTEAWADKNIS